MHASKAESMISADEVAVATPFGVLEEKVWRWENVVTREQIGAMVRSRSYYITGDAAVRECVDAAVNAVLDGLEGESIAMPYTTHGFRTTRP
jgi:hypothetical protein